MTRVTIDNILLTGMTRVDSSSGWNAPDHRTEVGFEYDSFVDTEDEQVTVEGWVDEFDLSRLKHLRDRGQPFPASVDHVNLSRAKLPSGGLQIEREGRIQSHRHVTITLEEITEAEIATAEVSIDTPSGAMGSAAEDIEPSIAYPEDDESGAGDDVSDEGGIVGTLSSVRESLSGVLS